MFKITSKKGFHITFENGWTVSVQFGPGNYCDNYSMSIREDDEEAGRIGSSTAECAVINPSNTLVQFPSSGGDTVSNRSAPAEVLEILKWAAQQEATRKPSDSEPIQGTDLITK